jgi:CubicO group peptidase (beta-lactamase class C family)
MKRIAYLLSILIVLSSCQQDRKDYVHPKPLSDNWTVSTPDKEGMDQEIINQLIPKISGDYENIDGIVVVRNGKLVVDEYFNGYNPEMLHKVFSVTKSVAGALVGIAIDQGHLKSEDDSIKNYMGAYLSNKNPSLNNLTIKHILTMTTGLDWAELGKANSQGIQVAFTNDWIEYTLSQNLTSDPGTTFQYSSGNSFMLAPILKNATGVQADEFADRYLFGPLGIKNYEWVKCSEFWTKTDGGEVPGIKKPEPIDYPREFSEFPNTGSGLKMRPRDMAKFGLLYLSNGEWEGKQIISEQWIKKSTQPHFGTKEYGYLWRLTQLNFNNEVVDCYFARGFGVQKIYVVPTLDLVVVLTQQNFRRMPEAEKETEDILENYILKSIKGVASKQI